MDQRASMVGHDIDIQAYQDAVHRLREEFATAEQSLTYIQKILASNDLDEKELKNLSKSMKPFINFVENKIKATILCSGPISSGKSSLLNAFLGNCILPSGNLETTETITKLIPFQEYDSNTCQLIKDNGDKKKLDAQDIYNHHLKFNNHLKQNPKEPLHLEIETQFLVLKDFRENPLLKRHQLEFVDLPGYDSEQKGKDERILNFSSTLGDFPKLILFIISPENIQKKSTSGFLDSARRVFIDEINSHKHEQNQFYNILQGIKGKEIIKVNDNEITEKLVQSRFCIVISKFDQLSQGEVKKIEEQFLKTYKIQPNFVSSKLQIEYNTLKHQITPLNFSVILQDKALQKKALKHLSPDMQENLNQQEPSSWKQDDLQNVMKNANKSFRQKCSDNNKTVEDSTRMQQLVFQLMIKITNECTQYLKNNSRKIEFLSEVFKMGLDEQMINEYIIPKDFESFNTASAQCYEDLKREMITLQQKQQTQLNTSIAKVEKYFTDKQTLINQIQEDKLELIQNTLEDITNELQENMQNLTEGTIEAIIQSMRSRMYFLKGQINNRISLILKAYMLAREQVYKSNLKADFLNQVKQQANTSFGTGTTTAFSTLIGGVAGFGARVVVMESIAAATAAGGAAAATIATAGIASAVAGVLGLIISYSSKRSQEQKTKQEITKFLISIKENLIKLFRRNQEVNYNLNNSNLNKSIEKIIQALKSAYAYKNQLKS